MTVLLAYLRYKRRLSLDAPDLAQTKDRKSTNYRLRFAVLGDGGAIPGQIALLSDDPFQQIIGSDLLSLFQNIDCRTNSALKFF